MKQKGRRKLKKVFAVFMTVFMMVGMIPQEALADVVAKQQIRIIVENNVWKETDGAPWSGTLVDEDVEIEEETDLIGAINASLEKIGKEKVSEDTQELTVMNGISNGDAGPECKWKININDNTVDNSLAGYTAASGNIKNGDVIRITYYGNVTVNKSPDEQNEASKNNDSNTEKEEDDEEPEEDRQKKYSAQSVVQMVSSNTTALTGVLSGINTVGTSNGVRVVVENNVYSKESGAAWDGTLVDEWVELNESSTVMTCVKYVLEKHGYSQTGAASNYISEINGLTAGSAGGYDGWMGTLNDWFTNTGLGDYTVQAGTLSPGDEIRIMYSMTMGKDIGGSWSNNNKTVKNIGFNKGILDKTFNKDIHEYTLTVPDGTEHIIVTPTASNKNFMVKTFVESTEYKRTAEVPVEDGTVITVKCGDPSWPSMNGGTYGDADKIPAESYNISVKLAEENSPPVLKPDIADTVEASVNVGQKYELNLSEVFKDPDNDSMTYTVSIDGSNEVPAGEQYSFEPGEEKQYTLVFKASDGSTVSDKTYTVKLVAVKEAVMLESLIVHTGTSPNTSNVLLRNRGDESYDTQNIFNPEQTEYKLGTIDDSINQLRFRAKANDVNAKVTLHYEGGNKDITWTSGSSKFANFLTAGKNEFTIVVEPKDGTTQKAATTYSFIIDQMPTMTALSASADGTMLYLDQDFKASIKNYTLTVPKNSEIIDFSVTPKKAEYEITYNDNKSSRVNIADKDVVEIKVKAGSGENELINTYTVSLERADTLGAYFKVSPKDAVVKVYDQNGLNISADEAGIFKGMFGAQQYNYIVTKYGYVAASGAVPASGGMIEINLEKAPDDGLNDLDAYWENFRGNDANMGITDAKTPTSAEDTAKLWNIKLGSGWGAAPSVQIIVDDALVVMSGNKLYKLDLESGDILKQGTMAASPNYGYTPPIYAEGMIFCPLQGGRIQAFNAETLESLWIYKDNLGEHQSLSPITYSDGYIYTGFWYSEETDSNYVCLSITDEDPTRPDEAKLPTWKHTQKGGFYWAGSVAIGNALIVGTDDGAKESTGNAKLYSFDKVTGEVISCLNMPNVGDQRSSIAYDKASSRVFFTTKNGYLCSALVDAATGNITDLKNKSCDEKVGYDAQSTSTPIVYKGKVYFATGIGFANGDIVVADAETLEVLYKVKLKGYPQCSLLMSTAYEEETGYIYLYSTYNNRPGGISVLKVKPETTKASEAELIELYDAEGFENYCITSIICGEDGTLYYKNDSGNVFAIGVPDVTVVKNLIEKIGSVGDVSLESENDIEDARKAYDALSEEKKAEIPNYEALVAAEARLSELQIENTEELIEKIGKVTLTSEEKITAAREAYDSLSQEQKAKVLNYDILTAAEKALKKLKDDQKNTSKNEANVTTPTITKSVTKSANINLTEQKVSKEELEKGRENHYDKATGIDVRDNSEDILPWYVKLNVVEQKLTSGQKANVKKAIGEKSKVFIMRDIKFINTKDGTEWQPVKPIKVKIPMVDTEDYENTVIIHIADGGKVELLRGSLEGDMIEFEASSFSLYGIAGTNLSIDEILETDTHNPLVWPWIVIAIIALAVVAVLIYKRKRREAL